MCKIDRKRDVFPILPRCTLTSTGGDARQSIHSKNAILRDEECQECQGVCPTLLASLFPVRVSKWGETTRRYFLPVIAVSTDFRISATFSSVRSASLANRHGWPTIRIL